MLTCEVSKIQFKKGHSINGSYYYRIVNISIIIYYSLYTTLNITTPIYFCIFLKMTIRKLAVLYIKWLECGFLKQTTTHIKMPFLPHCPAWSLLDQQKGWQHSAQALAYTKARWCHDETGNILSLVHLLAQLYLKLF